MAAPYLALGAPLVNDETPSRARPVAKALTFVSLFVGLACAAFWALNSQQEATVQPATNMIWMPMQQRMNYGVRSPSPVAPQMPAASAAARNFLQPAQAQASRSPIAGLVDLVIPVNDKNGVPKGEVDVIMPISKRDMMAAAAASAVGLLPMMAANADEQDAVRKKVCAGNPTAKICLKGSATRPK